MLNSALCRREWCPCRVVFCCCWTWTCEVYKAADGSSDIMVQYFDIAVIFCVTLYCACLVVDIQRRHFAPSWPWCRSKSKRERRTTGKNALAKWQRGDQRIWLGILHEIDWSHKLNNVRNTKCRGWRSSLQSTSEKGDQDNRGEFGNHPGRPQGCSQRAQRGKWTGNTIQRIADKLQSLPCVVLQYFLQPWFEDALSKHPCLRGDAWEEADVHLTRPWRWPWQHTHTYSHTNTHVHPHTQTYRLCPPLMYVIIISTMTDIWHRRMWGVKWQDSFLTLTHRLWWKWEKCNHN